MVDNLEQGFFDIEMQNGKIPENLGVLWRSTQNMRANLSNVVIQHIKNTCMIYNFNIEVS